MDDPTHGKGRMTITGKLSPTTTDLILTSDGTLPAPQKGSIHTVIKTENGREGECEPGQVSVGENIVWLQRNAIECNVTDFPEALLML
jgi:hypothetical protein